MPMWHNRDADLIPKPGGTIDTPLGALKIEVNGEYTLYCELAAPVKINNILCRVVITSRLDMHTENWWHIFMVDRVHGAQHSITGWTIGGSATSAACKKARSLIEPLLDAWIDAHIEQIEQGKSTADRNLVLRAGFRLDSAIAEIDQRRAELAAMQTRLDNGAPLTDNERRLLDDLWGHHWRF